MSHANNVVFKGLHIVAWIIFIGLCIEAGGLFINFIFNTYNPSFIPKLYQKLDLQEIYENSKPAFFGLYFFILVTAILKAYLFYIVIRLMYTLDLKNPFTKFVSNQFFLLSYLILVIGILSFTGRQFAKNVSHQGYDITGAAGFWVDSQAFILTGAIMYIIATIFSKGVEIQAENELTV